MYQNDCIFICCPALGWFGGGVRWLRSGVQIDSGIGWSQGLSGRERVICVRSGLWGPESNKVGIGSKSLLESNFQAIDTRSKIQESSSCHCITRMCGLIGVAIPTHTHTKKKLFSPNIFRIPKNTFAILLPKMQN